MLPFLPVRPQLISAVAHSPGASPDDVRQAAAWLKSLGEFAAGFLGACSSSDVFRHVPWGSAAMLLELWLLALAEHLQLCIYCSERMKRKESTAEDAGCVAVRGIWGCQGHLLLVGLSGASGWVCQGHLLLVTMTAAAESCAGDLKYLGLESRTARTMAYRCCCRCLCCCCCWLCRRPQAFDMLQYLLTWLAAPMRNSPGTSLAVGPGEDCSGQGCLVGLLEGTDWDSQLMPVALLLQGILLVTAGEHLLWQLLADEPVAVGMVAGLVKL
jgi:hypothetical protein